MDYPIIYQDENLLVINKPAGISAVSQDRTEEKTLIAEIINSYPELANVGEPPGYGLIHRLDKNTSGVILIAKNNPCLLFFQEQFKTRTVEKKYLALVCGIVESRNGTAVNLIGRSLKKGIKQKIFPLNEPIAKNLREAIICWQRIGVYSNGKDRYSLLEISPKTGRKHQIRAQLTYLKHPIAGDRLYGFKNQPEPKKLKRQFLHAAYLKIKLANGENKVFQAPLANDLKEVLKCLKKYESD